MISLIRGTLCGSAHRDRKLNIGCQGLEGRIMKNYSLMDLEFQFWEMKTSGNVLDNVTAVNPTEVSTSNGCDGKFYVCVFYHIFKKSPIIYLVIDMHQNIWYVTLLDFSFLGICVCKCSHRHMHEHMCTYTDTPAQCWLMVLQCWRHREWYRLCDPGSAYRNKQLQWNLAAWQWLDKNGNYTIRTDFFYMGAGGDCVMLIYE